MEINNIICIKARSHSDFELYLIAEKYNLAYDILLDYKTDKSIYKFWVELKKGIIVATESRSNTDKIVYVIDEIKKEDRPKLMEISPVKTPIKKSDSEDEYKRVKDKYEKSAKEKEEYRLKMLNRKYDEKNIICINLQLDNKQLFYISQYYKLELSIILSFKDQDDIQKVWLEKETSDCYAYEFSENGIDIFEMNPQTLIPRDVKSKMSMIPVNTPRIKKTKDNIDAYKKALEMSLIDNIKSFDNIIENGYNKETISEEDGIENLSIEDLEKLLENSVEIEDYESAADLRDVIIELKNKNSVN